MSVLGKIMYEIAAHSDATGYGALLLVQVWALIWVPIPDR